MVPAASTPLPSASPCLSLLSLFGLSFLIPEVEQQTISHLVHVTYCISTPKSLSGRLGKGRIWVKGAHLGLQAPPNRTDSQPRLLLCGLREAIAPSLGLIISK